MIVTSRGPSRLGCLARVARSGCAGPDGTRGRARGSAFRPDETRAPGDETQARLEPVTGACKLELELAQSLSTKSGEVSPEPALSQHCETVSSRARLDISPDHAISGGVGGDTPGSVQHRHQPTSGSEHRSDVSRDNPELQQHDLMRYN